MESQVNKSMDEQLNELPSAWKGHKDFAHWLVQRQQPKVTVELGVDAGYSLFCLAINNPGQVYGIDTFEGDKHAGGRNPDEQQGVVEAFIREHGYKNIILTRKTFAAASADWTEKVDILHIDGAHGYDDVKRDFTDWERHLHEHSVVLFHDTMAYSNDVGQFFREVEGFHKCNFGHSSGLGVMSKEKQLIDDISAAFSNNLDVNSYLA